MTGNARLWSALFILTAALGGLTSCGAISTPKRMQPDASARGKTIYQHHCIGCHGQHGTGDAFQSVPALAGQRFEYLRLQIERFAIDERHDYRMRRAFNRVSMNDPVVAVDVATYLSLLPMQRFADSDPRYREQGEKQYLARCATCHGLEAQGRSDGAVPALRAQHDAYLVHRLRRFASDSPTVGVAAHSIDDNAIVPIAAYLSSLQGLGINSGSALQQ